MRDKMQPRAGLALAAVCGALILTFAAAGEMRAQAPAAAAPGVTPERDERYRIGPGDVLEVRVYKRPELSRDTVRVDNSGRIRMPLVEEEIRAACLTESELAREIAARYTEYLRNPQVSVFVKEFKSTPVAVMGAVARPGRFQLERRLRLLDLLSLSGGPTERAGARLQLVRAEAQAKCGGETAGATAEGADAAAGFTAYDLNATLRGEESANPYVEPGDVVSLPEADQVYVVGNVFRPSSLALKERITVSQAVAMAGGALPDSKRSRVRIVRQGRGGERAEIFADLDAIGRRQAEDVALSPNDIVDVPTSTGKRIVRGLVGIIAPTAAQLPLRVTRGY